jgi:hypothetical protein
MLVLFCQDAAQRCDLFEHGFRVSSESNQR